MREPGQFLGLALLATGVFATTFVSAQERRARAGAVVVRPVQVREVRVDQPAPSRLEVTRPSFGVGRPVDPGFISRPLDFARDKPLDFARDKPIPRPRPSVGSRYGHRSRHRSSDFTPRFNVGHGVVVGYPILYPYAYPYDPFSPASGATYNPPPARNTYSNVDALSTSGNVTAASSLPAAIACERSAPCGGVSFDITPAGAQVYVDGTFAGLVEDFTDTSAPLLLAPGDHYVEIRLAGYRTASFDATIVSGEVTPYQGTLERLRLRTP
jgi:hypothetical protein